MRITRTEEFFSERIEYRDTASEFDRTGYTAEELVQLWCRAEPIRSHRYQGKTYPDRVPAGTGAFTLGPDGLIRFEDGWGWRTDIGCLQAYAGQQFLFNVFIEPSGRHSGPNGGGTVELDDEERAALDAAVAAWWERHRGFAERQQRFFRDRPWLQLVGLTALQALCRLDELGWPTGYEYRDKAFVQGVELNPKGG